MAKAQKSVTLPSVDERQNDKAMESVRARQMRWRLQHKGGEWTNPGTRLYYITPSAIN